VVLVCVLFPYFIIGFAFILIVFVILDFTMNKVITRLFCRVEFMAMTTFSRSEDTFNPETQKVIKIMKKKE
jgi:hypothetical protein